MATYLKKSIICVFLILPPLSVFLQIRHHSYITYDDPIIVNNTEIKKGLTKNNIIRAFVAPPDHIPYPMPIPLIVYMIEYEFFGDDYGKYHLVSLFVHILTSLFLFFSLHYATGEIGKSAAVTAIFSIHPLNVEPICWLITMNGLLMGLFFIFSVTAYFYYLQTTSIRRYILVLIFFTCGLLCKITIISLPFILLLLDYWPANRLSPLLSKSAQPAAPPKTGWMPIKLLIEKIPFLIIGGLFFLKTMLARPLPVSRSDIMQNLPLRLETIVYYVERLGKIFFPVGLSIEDTMPSWTWQEIAVALLLMLLITTAIIGLSKNRKYLVTGWFWYLGALTPAILMIAGSGRPMADKYMYIPGIGIFILLIWLGDEWLKQLKHHKIIRNALAVTVLFSLSLLSFSQVKHWKTSMTLYSHALTIDPDNQRALSNLGDIFLEKGELEKARHHFSRLLRISPRSPLAHNKMGEVLSRTGEMGVALTYYKRAIALDPDYTVAYNNMANLLNDLGRINDAIRHYRHALSINPLLFKVHNNLATALIKQKKYGDAIRHLQKALAINPDYITARENLLKINVIRQTNGALTTADE